MTDLTRDRFLVTLKALHPLDEVRGSLVECFHGLDHPSSGVEAHVDIGTFGILRAMVPRDRVEEVVGILDSAFEIGSTHLTVDRPMTHPLHAPQSGPFLVGAHLWCRMGVSALHAARTRPRSFEREALASWLSDEVPAFRAYPDSEVLWDLADRPSLLDSTTPLKLFKGFFAPEIHMDRVVDRD